MIPNKNLYDPVMYLINQNIKRHFNANPPGSGDSSHEKNYIEGCTISRDHYGRVTSVSGWEYIEHTISYNNRGIIDMVDIKHLITGKHLQIRLMYDDKNWLIEVEPEIMDEGTGEAGKINVPDVTEDYHSP